MRSFSIFLIVYLSWLAMPALGHAACLLLFTYFGWRSWGLMQSPDSMIQEDFAQDLVMVEGILGEVVSVPKQGSSGKQK